MPRDPNNDVRLQFEKALGSELGSLFSELWQELLSLHRKWKEYRVIFATSPEQLAIANMAAGSFFYLIQEVMWESILLHLARLTDPVQSPGKKENLTVAALAPLVRPEIRPEVEAIISKATSKTVFARDWRNRRLAHMDLPLALGNAAAQPLAPASRALITEALNSLGELLNFVEHFYTGGTAAFEVITTPNGAETLIFVLKRGLGALEQEEADERRNWKLE